MTLGKMARGLGVGMLAAVVGCSINEKKGLPCDGVAKSTTVAVPVVAKQPVMVVHEVMRNDGSMDSGAVPKDMGRVSWEEFKRVIAAGRVIATSQAHSLEVTVTMADGKTYHATEPAIDEIFRFLRSVDKMPAAAMTE
jgi:hypothetical protein